MIPFGELERVSKIKKEPQDLSKQVNFASLLQQLKKEGFLRCEVRAPKDKVGGV